MAVVKSLTADENSERSQFVIVRQSGYVDSVEKSYQDAETVGQQGEGWLGESLVLAQRAVSEDPRWTRAVRDSSGPY
jgi:hypothetical protein